MCPEILPYFAYVLQVTQDKSHVNLRTLILLLRGREAVVQGAKLSLIPHGHVSEKRDKVLTDS